MRAHNRVVIASLAFAIMAFTPAAHAQRYELGIGTVSHDLTAPSADALTDNSMLAMALSGGVHLPSLALPGVELRIDGMLQHGSVEGTTFRTMGSTTRMTMATVGVSALRNLGTRWQAFGRAAVGGARVSVELEDMHTFVDSLQDRGYAACAQLGAGADLILGPRRDRGLSFGLRLELGYTAMSGVDMQPMPENRADGDLLRIPEQSTSLGQLDLSAWTTRLALIGRY